MDIDKPFAKDPVVINLRCKLGSVSDAVVDCIGLLAEHEALPWHEIIRLTAALAAYCHEDALYEIDRYHRYQELGSQEDERLLNGFETERSKLEYILNLAQHGNYAPVKEYVYQHIESLIEYDFPEGEKILYLLRNLLPDTGEPFIPPPPAWQTYDQAMEEEDEAY